MKFSKLRQLLLVSAIGLVVATLFSGCQLVTIDYLFVATSASSISGSSTTCPSGEIETYAVDSQSGAIRTGAPQVCSGGTTPVALAISPGYQNLYVANQVDMNIVHFAVASNGVLTKKDSVTLATAPVAMAVSPDGNTLYVVSGTTTATLSAYTLSSGALGSSAANQVSLTIPGFATDSVVPTNVTVLASGSAVYVTAYDLSSYNPGGITTSTASPGWVFGFATGSGGALTPTAGSPYSAGVKPTALAADPTNRFVYVTDFASNQLIGYGIYNGYTLSFLLQRPLQDRRPAFVDRHRSSRQVHLCLQFARFDRNRIRDRSADRYTIHRGEHHRLSNQQHRYAARFCRSRSCARPLRLHSQLPRQLGLRFQARSDRRYAETDAGHPVSHGHPSYGHCAGAARQPLHTNRDAIAQVLVIASRSPANPAGLLLCVCTPLLRNPLPNRFTGGTRIAILPYLGRGPICEAEFRSNYPRWYRTSRRCSRRGAAGNFGMPGSGDGHQKAHCAAIAGAQRRS